MEGKFATRVREQVRKELRDNAVRLSEEECATRMRMSARSMRRFLHRLRAPTYRSIMSSEVFEYGKELLVNTRKPLMECARLCGFSRHSAFTRFMNRHLGDVTPSQYRAQNASVFTLIGREPRLDPCALGHE